MSLLHPVGFDPVMSDKSKCDCAFWSKPSMSNASFHNFNSRLNGLRCNFSANKLKLEQCGKDSACGTLCLFIQQTLSNPLRVVFPKMKIFPVTARLSSLFTGSSKVTPQALAIWAITPLGNYSLEQFSMTVKSNCKCYAQ